MTHLWWQFCKTGSWLGRSEHSYSWRCCCTHDIGVPRLEDESSESQVKACARMEPSVICNLNSCPRIHKAHGLCLAQRVFGYPSEP